MRNPILCLIVPLGDSGLGPVDPGWTGGIGRPGGPGGIGGPVDPGWSGGIGHPGGPGGGGPVDPGYNPPGVGGPGSGLGIWGGPFDPPRIWPRPPGHRPGGPVDPGWSGGWAPTDPGYNPPGIGGGGSRPQPPGWQPGGNRPWGGGPGLMPPIYVPPQEPIVDPGDPTKGYLVAYVPTAAGSYERITFTVDLPVPPVNPPTGEPEPKPV